MGSVLNPPQPPPGYTLDQPPQQQAGGALTYEQLRGLAEYAGLDPHYSGLMARVAMSESGGNIQSNASHKTSYVEKGKTYYPEGLWQISTVHGTGGGPMFTPLANAVQMVKLFNDQGLGPWEASRVQPGGGGWGQHVDSELGLPPGATPMAPTARVGFMTVPSGGAPPSPPPGYTLDTPSASGSAPPPPPGYTLDRQQGGVPPPPPGYTLDQPGQAHTAGGVGQLAAGVNKVVKKVLEHDKIRPQGPVQNWINNELATARTNADWVSKAPGAALFNVLGTASRVGMGLITGTSEGGPVEGLKQAAQSIFNASDANMVRLTQGTEHAFHVLPTHLAIDQWVKDYIPQEHLRPYIANMIKTGEDMGVQMAADPTTYIPLVGEASMAAKVLRAMSPLFVGMRVTTGVYELGKAAGIGRALGHIGPLAEVYQKSVTGLGEFYRKWFAVRPDLDHFSPEVKQARILGENAAADQRLSEASADAKALRGGDDAARQRFLHYYARYGSGANARRAWSMDEGVGQLTNEGNVIVKDAKTGIPDQGGKNYFREPKLKTALAMFMDSSPEKRMEIFNKMRKDISQGDLNARLRAAINASDNQGDKDWLALNDAKLGEVKTGAQVRGELTRELDQIPPLKALRNMARAAIIWWPFPHEVKNMGMLTYLAGGIPAVVGALKYMVKPPEAEAIAHLESLGIGVPQMMLRHEALLGDAGADDIWKNLAPDKQAKAVWGQVYKGMNRLEQGYRHSLFDILKKQGVSDEGAAWTVSQRLGDYRNTSAFVHLFESLGGPFVAFRLGIIPVQVFKAIRERPDRVLAIMRSQYDINANREGGKRNELVYGGPVEDFAKLVMSPLTYAQKTLPWEEAVDPSFAQKPLSQIGENLASTYVPGYSLGQNVARSMEGISMPEPTMKGHHRHQDMTLTDQLTMLTINAVLGMYVHAKETPQQAHKIYEHYRKGGF